ncbi:arylamine N-acetyltransferase [Salicibibacter halophilus]|uniref:Arylamine N-acetyltransferase n=1 Tax=Salicibibacter halophilus TaxID=2502791 RepID=A0A514LFT8_9BACI|nr:arylamine N-acetyltransferase [Salicibibacter halophilus]QDI90714.1 arylamine N-acetyltransferase [Salicibibacter halophilus]
MTQKQLPQWAMDYLHYIQVPVRETSYSYLKEISTAHLNRIPFENISTMLHYKEYHEKGKLVQDEKRFVNQLFQYHMGGTCYMLNSSLHQLLKQLGFHSRYTFLGGGHVALLVRLPNEGEELYVDVGNGSPFFEPIRLETDSRNVSQYGGIEVRIRQGNEHGAYKYYRYVDGKLLADMDWSFDTNKTYQFDDFQSAIREYFQYNGPFTSALRCQIWQLSQKRSLSLVNNVLSIRYSDGEVEKRVLTDRYEIRSVIDHEFNLPKLPVESAIEILEELGVNIFQDQKEYEVD